MRICDVREAGPVLSSLGPHLGAPDAFEVGPLRDAIASADDQHPR